MKKIIIFLITLIVLSSGVFGWWFFPDAPPPVGVISTSSSEGTVFDEINRFYRTGENATGDDGNISRTITLNNTITSKSNKLIIVDNYLLNESFWNFTHDVSTNITFIEPIWNESEMMIDIYVDQYKPYEIYSKSFTGIQATGSDGAINRTILLVGTTTLPEWELIEVDDFFYIEALDYVIEKNGGTTIRFLNELWDSQVIEVRYYQNEN